MTPLPLDRPAYLGLDRDPTWLGYLDAGLRACGAHYAGSRRAAYCPPVYDRLEERLADWMGAPAALTMSSASLAAATLAESLTDGGSAVLAGPLAHAAWKRPGGVTTCFDDDAAWRAAVRRLLAAGRAVAVVTDRVCALRAREADFSWLTDLPGAAGSLTVVVDDSHALGALRTGRGSYAELRAVLPPATAVLSLASLGKAFSMPGAVIAGTPEVLREVWTRAGFGGASPLPPAYAHALSSVLGEGAAAAFVAARLRQLSSVVAAVEGRGLRGPHVTGHPVFRVDDPAQRAALAEVGIVLSEVAYPRAESAPVTRLVLRAGADGAEAVARIARALG